jgi:hypothetical protein
VDASYHRIIALDADMGSARRDSGPGGELNAADAFQPAEGEDTAVEDGTRDPRASTKPSNY